MTSNKPENKGMEKKPRPRRSQSNSNELALEKLADRFDTSARRWELIVYPSLFAFVILAGYGFFLVYSLTQDMHLLARSMDNNMGEHMESLTNSVESLAMNVDAMTSRIEEIAGSVGAMDSNMATISSQLDTMDASMTNMDYSMRSMNMNTGLMTQDMKQLNQNVGRPMSFMNTFMPW